MRGFSTIELLIALTIMTTSVSAVALVTVSGPIALTEGLQEQEAVRAAGADILNAFLIDSSVLSTHVTNGATVNVSDMTLPDGITTMLERTLVWHAWNGNSQMQHTKQLWATLMDLSLPASTGCDPFPSGDWVHPVTNTTTLNSFPVTSLTVSGTSLFVSASSTVNKTDPKIQIFDISSTTNPTFESSILVSTTTRAGISSMIYAGTVLYAANASMSSFSTCTTGLTCSQFIIFDVSSSSPVVRVAYQLSTTSPPYATGSTGQSSGKSIAYAAGRIYLGLTKSGSSQGDEFNIIDVHDPMHPVWIGGFVIGRSINQIQIWNGYAYLATDDPQRALIVLDVHDPMHISLVNSYGVTNTVPYGYGRAVALTGTGLLLGRTYVPSAPELLTLTNATSSSPFLRGTVTVTPKLTGVESVLVRSFLAFVLTDTSFQVWNMTDADHPTPYSAPLSLPQNSTGTALACRGNTLYIASVGANHTGYLTAVTTQ